MTNQDRGRRLGLARAANTTREQRRKDAERANVTKWILSRLGRERGPSVSPFEVPYRVRRPE